MDLNEVDRVLGNLVRAVKILEASREVGELIPEVRVNIVYALPDAVDIRHVAGIEGRITKIKGRPQACGYPSFGASSHMARIVLEVMRFDRNIRAGMNLLWNEDFSLWLERWSKENGISFGFIDRSMEPEEIIKKEGASIPWKIRFLLNKYGYVPRIFYETAGIGKEPLTVLLGEDAVSVAVLAVRIAKEWSRYQVRLSLS